MRVLLSLILLVVLLSTIEATENLYVNFIPFISNDCSGQPSGVGYSGLVFTCFTFDNLVNYVFKPSQNGMVTINKYKAIDTQTKCIDLVSSYSTNNGNCVSADEIGNLDSTNIPSTPQGSYRMELSNNFPLIVPNSYTTAYSSGQCNSNVPGESALLYEYYTNGTFINFNSEQPTGEYQCYCDNGEPYATNEPYEPANMGVLCDGDTSFFNSSSEIPNVSGIATGSGSISGGISSGTGSGNNNHLNLQINTPVSNSNSDSSYSYSYYSVYCSN